LAALYRAVAAGVAPWLWPAADAALPLTFVAFGVAALGFGLQSALLLAHGNGPARERHERDGHRAALAYVAAVITVVGLAWFAVATG
jgi:hypothetical protein